MFVLRIPVTPVAVEQIKVSLTNTVSSVKSSHRVEALGRGLGFRTYAALQAASQTREVPIAVVRGDQFSGYLKEHAFDVGPASLYRAAAEVAVRGVLEAEPRLHIGGIGFGQPQRNEDGSWQTHDQRYTQFLRHRQECFGNHAAEAFLRSLALLSRVKETRTIRVGAGSYRLKHIAENYHCTYPEGEKLGPDYVPNGMLIAAALHLGFKYKTYVDHLGYGTLNANFNMSKMIVDDLDAEIRPRGGFAQDRRRKLQNRVEFEEARKRFKEIGASLRKQAR